MNTVDSKHTPEGQQQIVSAEELEIACDVAYKKAGHNAYFSNGFSAGFEYASLKLQSLTTEIDEALKANDLLCKKIDQKDNDLYHAQGNLEIAERLNREYLEALKEIKQACYDYEDNVQVWKEEKRLLFGDAEFKSLDCMQQQALKAIEKVQSLIQKSES
jgi:hypothetical protein